MFTTYMEFERATAREDIGENHHDFVARSKDYHQSRLFKTPIRISEPFYCLVWVFKSTFSPSEKHFSSLTSAKVA